VTVRPERLVLLGSVVADVMMTVPRLPDRGGDVLASRAVVQPGGGFNVLAAARRFGLPAALGGHVGDGPFGRVVAAGLAAEGVQRRLPASRGDTGFVLGFVEPDGERTFVTSPGVESVLSAGDLAAVGIARTDAVYVSGYDLCYPVTGPTIAAWVGPARPALLVLDPGPLVAQIPPAVLRPVLAATAILTLSRRELALLAGQDGWDAVHRVREWLPPSALVVVRDGANGCTLYAGDAPGLHVPAPRVTVVDTTGAGDAHTGAFLTELHRGVPVPAALATANAAAALSVTRRGSATAPTRGDVLPSP
jgi:sugar/nucleoside kinase (ribokinase family)